MNKPAAAFASNHHSVRVGPPNSANVVSASPEPIDAEFLHAVERSIKRYFLRLGGDDEGLEITVTGCSPIRFVTKQCGRTAFVAGGICKNDDRTESLTICCAGLDKHDDEKAIAAVSEMTVRDGLEKFLEDIAAQVRKQPRPFAVHIHLNEASIGDRTVRIVTHCLAESFFDQFGMDKTYRVTV